MQGISEEEHADTARIRHLSHSSNHDRHILFTPITILIFKAVQISNISACTIQIHVKTRFGLLESVPVGANEQFGVWNSECSQKPVWTSLESIKLCWISLRMRVPSEIYGTHFYSILRLGRARPDDSKFGNDVFIHEPESLLQPFLELTQCSARSNSLTLHQQNVN